MAQSVVISSEPTPWAPLVLENGNKTDSHLGQAQFGFCTQPSLYQTQTILGIYPVLSVHLQVSFPKTKKQNRKYTDLLFLPCKRGKAQHTSV